MIGITIRASANFKLWDILKNNPLSSKYQIAVLHCCVLKT